MKKKNTTPPHIWHKPPARGMKNVMAEHFKYTVVRLADSKERFCDRLPRKELRASYKYTVWDNKLNCELWN